jgi:DmsE family decaheme c-type cytochrome
MSPSCTGSDEDDRVRNGIEFVDVSGSVTRRPGASVCVLMASLLAAAFSMLPASDSAAQARQGTQPQYTADGTKRCMQCHGAPRIRVVAATPHGNTSNPFTPYSKQGCEACHGPGSLHVSRTRGGIGFPQMLSFTDEPSSRKNEACLDCHAHDMGDLEGFAWAGSVHDAGGISCVDCHQLHAIGNPLAERDEQVAVCGGCHAEQIANHRRFEDKGIVFDELNCYNCHDVHQMVRER